MNDSHSPGAADPLDDQDFSILQGIRESYEAIDPMPAEVLDNIRFSVVVRELEVEIARESSEILTTVTRGGGKQRLITFESPNMTVICGVRVNDDGTVRIDGWLTPPGAHTVELRTPQATLTTASNERGRFAWDGIPRTTTYLTVRTPDHAVTTSTIRL